jgi:hypothetical protein
MGTRRLVWSAVLAVTWFFVGSVAVAPACTIATDIQWPPEDDTIRDGVMVKGGAGCAQHGVDSVQVCFDVGGHPGDDDNLRYIRYYGAPYGPWQQWFPTGKHYNTAGNTFTILSCARCMAGYSAQHYTHVKLDNHYVIAVYRGYPEGAVDFKYLTGQGSWTSLLSQTYACKTIGAGPDTCSHGAPHDYCTNMNTPPYTKSNPSDETTYPTLNYEYNDVTLDSWTQNPGAYTRTLWPTSEGGDGHYYYTDPGSGHVVGRWFVNLPDRTAPCGCFRTGIHIHGGKATSDMAVALAPNQALDITHGCIRMHNGNLGTLITSYIDVYRPYADNSSAGRTHMHIAIP